MLRIYRLAPHKRRTVPDRPRSTQVRALLDYDILAPILLGAGAVGGAWLNQQLRLQVFATSDQTVDTDSTRRRRRAKPPAQHQAPAQQHQLVQQQQQNQQQNQEPQQDEQSQEDDDKLAALQQLVLKQQQQIAQLQRDKQQMQQAAKKDRKAYEKLEGQLGSTQQELAMVKQQHTAIAIDLLQTQGDLEQANRQLQQKDAELESLWENASSINAGTASGSDLDDDDAALEAAAAADGAPRPKCIAVLGGKELKDSHRKMFPGCHIRHFGSIKDCGVGDVRRLEECIKRGTIDEVYMLIRWNGHNETTRIASLCRRLDIPVNWMDSTQIVRAKNAAGVGASSSDASNDEAGM